MSFVQQIDLRLGQPSGIAPSKRVLPCENYRSCGYCVGLEACHDDLMSALIGGDCDRCLSVHWIVLDVIARQRLVVTYPIISDWHGVRIGCAHSVNVGVVGVGA